MAKQGRRKKKTHVPVDTDVNDKIPKSFVLKSGMKHTGNFGHGLNQLVRDVRRVMEPNTATKLTERRNNKLKDYIDIAGPLGVSHLLIFSRSTTAKKSINFKITRSQTKGPTLCFNVLKYSLIKDVLKKNTFLVNNSIKDYATCPVVVLNNFGGMENQIKLMSVMFQGMFPPINVQQMKLSEAKRIVLFNYNSQTKEIDFRHYNITIKKDHKVSKSIKTILYTKNMPDMTNCTDISEFILKGAFATESDVEDEEATFTASTSAIKKDEVVESSMTKAVKLTELGPRLRLKLIKIQTGICGGEVIYHDHVSKTEEEVALQKRNYELKAQAKAQRKAQQEANVLSKQKPPKRKRGSANADGSDREESDEGEEEGLEEEMGESDDDEEEEDGIRSVDEGRDDLAGESEPEDE